MKAVRPNTTKRQQQTKQENKLDRVPDDSSTQQANVGRHSHLDGVSTEVATAQYPGDNGRMDIDDKPANKDTAVEDTEMEEPGEESSVAAKALLSPFSFSRPKEPQCHDQWFMDHSIPGPKTEDTFDSQPAARGVHFWGAGRQTWPNTYSALVKLHGHELLPGEDVDIVGYVGSAIRSFQLQETADNNQVLRQQLELKRLEVAMYEDRARLSTARLEAKELEYKMAAKGWESGSF